MSILQSLTIGLGPAILFLSSAWATPRFSQEKKEGVPAKEVTEKSSKEKTSKAGSEKKAPDKKATEKKDAAKTASDKGGKTETADSKKSDDADIQLVKESLKEFIHGTIAFDAQNVVTIEYDLKKKKEEFQNDFRPPINPKIGTPFRWSIREEEWVMGGDYGIRISDGGVAVLNLWFKDDVEATMEYLNGISWSKRQICAIVFQAKNGQALGNNYGGQCALFAGGAYKGGNPPTTQQLPFNDRGKIGLRVLGGTFEALWNGKSRKTQKYSPKSFSSGRIGFFWGGKVAGTITSLTIKGKIDFAAMAKEMRSPSSR